MKKKAIKKETLDRLHKYCQRGERHDNVINRLINACKQEQKTINLSDKTTTKLLKFTDCENLDEALNVLMDKCRKIKKS